jgi:hypothetical protein
MRAQVSGAWPQHAERRAGHRHAQRGAPAQPTKSSPVYHAPGYHPARDPYATQGHEFSAGDRGPSKMASDCAGPPCGGAAAPLPPDAGVGAQCPQGAMLAGRAKRADCGPQAAGRHRTGACDHRGTAVHKEMFVNVCHATAVTGALYTPPLRCHCGKTRAALQSIQMMVMHAGAWRRARHALCCPQSTWRSAISSQQIPWSPAADCSLWTRARQEGERHEQ